MANELTTLLNEREAACNDAAATLTRATAEARAPSLRVTFEEHAGVLKRCSRELQDLLVEWKELPAESGTTAGALRRGIAILRDTLIEPSDATLLAESQVSLERVTALYRTALDEANPEAVNALLARQSLQLEQCRIELARLAKDFSAPIG